VSIVANAGDDQVSLGDGRSLAFAEWGERAGQVVMFCHGGQMSRLVAPAWDVAETVGIRVVSADRPGIGRSDFYEPRSVLDWAGDVVELMSHLKVERFSVVGVSAGTPYALACGLVLSEQVDQVGVIAGIVPPELYERDDLVALVAADPDGARRVIDEHVQQVAADIPASIKALGDRPGPDGPFYRQPSVQAALTEARREAYRGGSRGVAQDILLINSPWGFNLADLEVPCLWWQGEADPITPVHLVEQASASMASCTLEVIAGVGHGVSMTHAKPFLEALVGRT
jgi:pimeloyl-ACP methyl ester carboxylesterase